MYFIGFKECRLNALFIVPIANLFVIISHHLSLLIDIFIEEGIFK